jgi:uncharacterized protein (DUF1697 family)
MDKYIVFVRGINVGGVVLKMEDFRKILSFIGFSNIQTYIQSGNAIFESKDSNKRKMEAEIAYEIKNVAGIDVGVIVLTQDELKSLTASHPLKELGDPKNLYVTLLSHEPDAADAENLLDTMNEIDTHVIKNRAVYSYYGEGYGNSKRSNNFIEKMLKVMATTRNWNTMEKLYSMINE